VITAFASQGNSSRRRNTTRSAASSEGATRPAGEVMGALVLMAIGLAGVGYTIVRAVLGLSGMRAR
jgi:hypothetical protein